METKANYALIGIFALAGFIGILAFFLWFANVQLNRQFAYYEVDFPTVSGLSEASDVRFAGLGVGRVVDVRLSPERDGTVRVRVEVAAITPVRTDSIATIEAQGVTGVAFVSLSAGSPDAPLVSETEFDGVPMIAAGQSFLQSLSEDAPRVVSETLRLVRDLRNVINSENRERIDNIIVNVERSSENIAGALDEVSSITSAVSTFADQIDEFNTTIDRVSRDISSVLIAAENTLNSIDQLSSDARGVLSVGSETLTTTRMTIESANRYILEDLGPATDQLSRSVAGVEARFSAFSDNADDLIATFEETGSTATARLKELRDTITAANSAIARMDQTLGSVDSAALSLDTLINDDAGPLVVELRGATADARNIITRIGNAAETDLPSIMADIRSAASTASTVIETVGSDLSSASGRLDELASTAVDTLGDARTTFANANETMSAINTALETGDRALSAAESAFRGADRVMNEEVAGIVESLRRTLAELERAVGRVAADIPAVTSDLRSASQSAEAAFASLENTVNAAAPGVRDFTASALPQFGRLAAETRALIDNLDALVSQISRDPSRFLFNSRSPEFRR